MAKPTSTELYRQANTVLANVEVLKGQLPQPTPDHDVSESELAGAKTVYDQINAAMGHYDEIMVQADLLARTEKASKNSEDPAPTPPASTRWRESAPNEGDYAYDPQGWKEVKSTDIFGRETTIRYNDPLVTEKEGYAGAFEGYIRHGFESLGPTDRKTLLEGTDTAGGFLVAPDYHAQLIKKVAGLTAIRPLARVIQVSGDTAVWPRINYTTNDKFTSPVRLTWTGETPPLNTTARVTDPTFGVVTVSVKTAMASLPLSNDLIEDAAFDVIGIATDLFAEAYALGEDDSFINGPSSGSSGPQPQGILAVVDDAGGTGVASQSTTTDNQITFKDMLNLFYKLPAQYRRNSQFVLNSNTMNTIEQIVDTQGRPIITSLISGSLAQGPFDTIKGKPVNVDEFMPDVSTDAYPILFGDFSSYLIADRVGLSIKRITELYAETNVTVLLGRRRVGGQLVAPWAMKVLKT